MKPFQWILMGFLCMGTSIHVIASSNTVVIENSVGETIDLGIDANDCFLDVVDQIQAYFQEEWSLSISHAGLVARAKKEARDYHASVSKSEKDDIAYIVNTLAYESLIKIGSQKSSLKKAGDRIDHIHPFKFLEVVFNNEKLKVGIDAIRGQSSWVKDGFFDGFNGSLKEEAARNNLLPFVNDFAKRVKIDAKLITPALKKGDWKGFINTLIEEIPREKDPKRYNM